VQQLSIIQILMFRFVCRKICVQTKSVSPF
jgi:hypothetical protein